MPTDSQIQTFRVSLKESSFVTPRDEGYDNAIKRWNDAGEKRAGAVVFVTKADDVSTAIKLAGEFDLEVAVRGGGHSHFDASSTDGGLVIDLSKMRKVTIDEAAKTTVVEGGALWSDVDTALGEKGLAAVGGTVNHTGVGGLTLGGGYGWLSGQHGLVIDNLLSATLVLADGSIVTATDSSHPDLFWAIRGGGGNFGIAVEFVYQVYEKKNDVFAGMLLYTIDKLPQIVEFLNTWSSNQQPNESVLLSFATPPPLGGELGIGVVPFYDGKEVLARERFAELLRLDPVVNGTEMIPYSTANSLLLGGTKHGRRKCQKGAVWEPPLTMESLNPVIDEFSSMLNTYPDTKGSVILIQFDHPGKIASVRNDAMAFPNRGHYRLAMIEVQSSDESLDSVRLDYARKIGRMITSWGDEKFKHTFGARAYSNYATGDEDPREIFGINYARLARIKAIYDPKNVFNKWFPVIPEKTSL